MTNKEQKLLTPSELLLYKHALEYRYKAGLFKYIEQMYKNIPSTYQV